MPAKKKTTRKKVAKKKSSMKSSREYGKLADKAFDAFTRGPNAGIGVKPSQRTAEQHNQKLDARVYRTLEKVSKVQERMMGTKKKKKVRRKKR
jgi:hypothetical protein